MREKADISAIAPTKKRIKIELAPNSKDLKDTPTQPTKDSLQQENKISKIETEAAQVNGTEAGESR